MPNVNEFKLGMVIDINGAPHIVRKIDVRNPSSRGASTLYKIRFSNIQTGQKVDESLKGDDYYKEADCQRVNVQYSYSDGDSYTFMNMEDFSQYTLNREDIEDQVVYLTEGLEGITALLIAGEIKAIELPVTIVFTVEETPPSIKGASAANRTKTARMTTGLEIQVPEYLETGDVIKVNTLTGKFMSRA
ncbi:MAG: elongation factor P-like protein YeiP [Gammaproteobacteria bacterium]|nr:elongation factor P-like protein YeiP [Gammaproteobacteria bacterium]